MPTLIVGLKFFFLSFFVISPLITSLVFDNIW